MSTVLVNKVINGKKGYKMIFLFVNLYLPLLLFKIILHISKYTFGPPNYDLIRIKE